LFSSQPNRARYAFAHPTSKGRIWVRTRATKVFPKLHDVPKPDESTGRSSNSDRGFYFAAS
jgi:hypothetical protein